MFSRLYLRGVPEIGFRIDHHAEKPRHKKSLSSYSCMAEIQMEYLCEIRSFHVEFEVKSIHLSVQINILSSTNRIGGRTNRWTERLISVKGDLQAFDIASLLHAHFRRFIHRYFSRELCKIMLR